MVSTQRSHPEAVPFSAKSVIALMVAYWATVLLSRVFFRAPNLNLAIIWPAAGIGTFAMLRLRGRDRQLMLAFILVANIGGSLATAVPILLALGYGVANAVESWVAAELILRGRRRTTELSGPKHLVGLALGSFIAAVISGGIASLWARASIASPLLRVWWHWSSQHWLGILLVLVALLPWTGYTIANCDRSRGSRLESAAFVLLWPPLLLVLFGLPLERTHTLPYVTLPVLLWAACRLPLPFTTLGGLALAIATAWGTRMGGGLFAALPYDPHTRLVAAQFFAAGTLVTSTLVRLVLAERERAEAKALTNEQAYRDLIETAEEGIWTIDKDAKTTFVNRKMAEMLGYPAEEMIGRSVLDFMDPAAAADASARLRLRHTEQRREQTEWRYRRKDGTPLWAWVSISPRFDNQGGWAGDVAMMSDITERKRTEKEREMTIAFLHLVNEARGTRALVQAAASFFQQESGCEAVGIRLREGDDYPYYEARGFSAQFVQAENSLCTEAAANGRAAGGEVNLACMCGNVINGTVDPSKPFFTLAGSFWTNSTTRLLATTSEAERQGPTRNRCNKEGYEAVALIPLRLGEQRLGLLQLNDHREGMFSPDLIASWERLAGHLSIALAKCRAEEAMQDSERKHRMLLEQASDAIFTTDLDGRLLLANSRTCEMLGYSQEELLALNLRDIIASSDQDRRPLAFDAVKEGRTVVTDRHYRRKDGSLVAVESSVKRGCGDTLQVIARDITERQLAEGALRRSESSYRSLVQNAPYGIYRCNLDGGLVWANPRLVELLDYDSEKDLLCVNFAGTVYADSEQRRRLMQKLERDGEVRGAQVRWTRKDGKSITVRLSARMVCDEGQFEVMVEDISESLQLEAQLRQAQKLEAIGRLAGGTAHDFNNILMVITSYGQMLQDRLPGDERLRKYTHQILKGAERAANLTHQLLAFSRKQLLSFEPVALNLVVQETTTMLRRLIGEDIELVFDSDPSLEMVKADSGQMVQVLMNLCLNARDAMADGGKLTIETRNVLLGPADIVHMHPMTPGAYVLLRVTDSGIGMSPEVKQRLFEPFFTTKQQGKGTGLGLATVYGIVKQSEGFIWCDSEPGRGTSFQLYFPKLEQAAPSSRLVAEPAAAGSETVLLVEDELALRESLAEYLVGCGYAVLAAENGAHALEVAGAHSGRIDILITDVVMPRMGGRELAERLGQIRSDIRVLFMSGYTDEAVIRRGVLDAGLAFIQKPYTMRALAKKLREVMTHPSPSLRAMQQATQPQEAPK